MNGKELHGITYVQWIDQVIDCLHKRGLNERSLRQKPLAECWECGYSPVNAVCSMFPQQESVTN